MASLTLSLIHIFEGAQFPAKSFDDEPHRLAQALRYAAVLNDTIAQQGVAGSFGWCKMCIRDRGAAAGTGDLDAAPAPGNAQLLAALGAAVIVVEPAVVPLVLQADVYKRQVQQQVHGVPDAAGYLHPDGNSLRQLFL